MLRVAGAPTPSRAQGPWKGNPGAVFVGAFCLRDGGCGPWAENISPEMDAPIATAADRRQSISAQAISLSGFADIEPAVIVMERGGGGSGGGGGGWEASSVDPVDFITVVTELAKLISLFSPDFEENVSLRVISFNLFCRTVLSLADKSGDCLSTSFRESRIECFPWKTL